MEPEKKSLPRPSLDRSAYLLERSKDIHRGKPGWNLLDPELPEPEKPVRFPLLIWLFDKFMVISCLAIIFVLVGGFFVARALGPRNLHIDANIALIIFLVGGTCGIGVVIWSYFRKS